MSAKKLTDKERMDWLEKRARALEWHGQKIGWTFDGSFLPATRGRTARHAIDAAILAERKETNP